MFIINWLVKQLVEKKSFSNLKFWFFLSPINFLVVIKVTGIIPAAKMSISQFIFTENIPLADPHNYKSGKIRFID